MRFESVLRSEDGAIGVGDRAMAGSCREDDRAAKVMFAAASG